MSKLNKKGFTLIELLAVIAILAILMLLVTPQILTLFSEGKKNTFAIQVQNIYKAAEQKYMTESFKPGAGPTYTFCYAKDSAGLKLDISGSNAVYYKVVMDTNAKVTEIIVTDGTYGFKKTSASGIAINEISVDASELTDYNASTHAITCTPPTGA